MAAGWHLLCSSCHNVHRELSTFFPSITQSIFDSPTARSLLSDHLDQMDLQHRVNSWINTAPVSTKPQVWLLKGYFKLVLVGKLIHIKSIYIKGSAQCLLIIHDFVRFCAVKTTLEGFYVQSTGGVDTTFAFHNPSYSKDLWVSALWDTTTFPPTHTETIVCTRVTLSELNMDIVFRVGGRSRQRDRILKRMGSFIINE